MPPRKPDDLDAPGLRWRPRKGGWITLWIARPDLIARGYRQKSVRLWNGIEPSAQDWAEIGQFCRRHQTDMLAWGHGGERKFDPRGLYDGTFGSAVKTYLTDPDSPFQALRYRVKLAYESKLRSVVAEIGTSRIQALSFREFKRMHETFRKAAVEDGPPRTARAHGLMTMVRIVMRFGVLLRLSGCIEAQQILSNMEFPNPKRRTKIIGYTQAALICAEAHRVGLHSIALAQALMSGHGLRQRDVLGEWLPIDEPGISDITAFGRKWMHGLHWNEISADMVLTHRLSKSLRGRDAVLDPGAGKTESFPLADDPLALAELDRITNRTGPLVVCEFTGRPWDHKTFQRRWRKIATAVGVPSDVQNRDSRAGFITEGRKGGATLEDMRIAAGHSKISTTEGYDRADLETRSKVVGLRTARKEGK